MTGCAILWAPAKSSSNFCLWPKAEVTAAGSRVRLLRCTCRGGHEAWRHRKRGDDMAKQPISIPLDAKLGAVRASERYIGLRDRSDKRSSHHIGIPHTPLS